MEAPSWTNFFRDNSHSRRDESHIEHENFFAWRSLDRRRHVSSSGPAMSSENHFAHEAYRESEIVMGPCRHTPQRYSGEMQYFAPISPHSNKNRALPPIPNDTPKVNGGTTVPVHSESSLQNGHTQPELSKDNKQSTKSDSRQKKRRSRGSSSTDWRANSKRNSKRNSETSVVLTVSIRNGNTLEKLKEKGLMLNNNQGYELSPTRKNFQRESTNSRADLMVVPRKPRRRRRRRGLCILPMVVMTILILGGLLAAVGVVLLRPQEEEAPKPKAEFDMVLAQTHMRVLNKKFDEAMKHNTSEEYYAFVAPFTDEVNDLFLKSNYSAFYYGSEVSNLRQGSINTISDVIFKDSEDLRNPKTIENMVKQASVTFTYKDNKAIDVGGYVVDYNSIFVDIKPFKTYSLPQRPVFKGNGVKYEEPGDAANRTTAVSSRVSTMSTSYKITETTTASHGTTTAPRRQRTQASVQATVEKTTFSPTSVKATESKRTESLVTMETSTYRVIKEFGSDATPSTQVSTLQTTLETPIPTIVVSNITINTTARNASVVCRMTNIEYWEYLTVEHVTKDNTNTVIINVTSEGFPDFPSMQYAYRLFLDLRIGFSSANVTLNFTVDCSDDGVYLCKAYRDGDVYSGDGQLRIRDPPTVPNLTFPIEIVENRQIRHPIVCRANVGFPPGKIQWMIKPLGHGAFIPVPGTSETSSGKCGNIITSEFVFTPSMEGNGTTLKCQVINDMFQNKDQKELSDSSVIRVVPASVCQGQPSHTTIRHPYRCDKYINCTTEDDFSVFQCPRDLCFDLKTKQCGQTGLTLTNSTAYLNEGVASLTCRLQHVGRWSGLRIHKVTSSGGKYNLLRVKYNPEGEPNQLITKAQKNRIFVAVKTKRYEVDVTLWIYKLSCKDEGQYLCEAETPFYIPDAIGFVQLKVKPETPKLKTPTEIIDGRQPREKFVCRGNVGYPGGKLYWEAKYPGRENFTKDLLFNVTENVNSTNCFKEITKEFSFIPTLKMDGLELRCVIENEDKQLTASYKVYVIPADICKPNSTDPLPHPSDCRQYIQCTEDYMYVQKCSQSLCFNPVTKQCDLPEPTDNIPVDPNFPCRPNRNGVYFPHPFVCNMYIWCVGGKEVMQRCPLGTLYRDEGQCTFDTDKNSHCYKNDKGE